MNAVGCERAVRELLRHDYGVTDARIEGGGRHRALVFTSPTGGARVKTTWPNHPTRGDWGITLDVKTRDLRRLLGEPKIKETKSVTTNALANKVRTALPSLAAQLETPVPPPPPAEPELRALSGWRVSAYSYENGTRLKFTFPTAQRGSLGERVHVERLDKESWQLITRVDGRKLTPIGKDLMLTGAKNEFDIETAFGRTPATALVNADGSVTVHCPTAIRTPSKPHAPRASLSPPAAAETPATLTVATTTVPTVAEIKACLAMIRRVEAETEYRLVKSKELNDWLFVSRIE